MKNFFLKTGLTLLCLIIGLGSAWGETASVELCTSWNKTLAYATAYTNDYTIDNLNGGTTTLTLGVQGVYRQSNSNTYFQMNKKSGYFKNTTKLPGKIKKIETTWNVAKGATKCYFAENAQATSSDATVTVTAETSVTYTPLTDADYYYFNIDPSTGSGSAQMTSCIVYYESVSAATPHTVTFDAGPNGSCSTSSLTEASAGAGVTLPSCTANTNYTFVGWSTSSTPTSADAGTAGANYKPSADCTLYAYYTYQAPSHTAHFSINGTIDNTKDCTVAEGEAITLPSDLDDINGKKFMGWVTSTIDGTTNTEPSFVTSANMGTADVTYYAVYATQTGSGSSEPTLVNSTSGLIAGNTYYIAASATYASTATAMGASTGGNNFPAMSFQYAVPLTLGGNATDGWTFSYTDGGTTYYLDPTNTTDKNYLKRNTSVTNYGKFSISFSSNAAVITSLGKSSRNILRYNSSSTCFSCYSSGQGDVYLFAEGGGTTYSDYCTTIGDEPTPTKTLTSIEVTGTPDEFWKGDDFNHNGITVTAYYDDSSNEDVTNSATFSTPDMSTAGEKTVTVTYQDQTDTYNITVNTIANTQATAYTVARAKELIDAGKDLSTEVYVAGKVSQVDSYSSTYNSITYWISADGTTTDQFEVYSGKGLDNANFSSKDDVQVGADVIVYGVIKKFNTTYEFDKNNYLVSYSYTPPTTDFIKTPTATVKVLDPISIKDYINGEYSSYDITTSIDGETQKDYEFVCIYDQIRFCKAGTYVVDVTGTSGSDTQNGQVTFTVTPTGAELSSVTIGGTLTKTTYTVGESFDFDGLTLTATCSDNPTADVTDEAEWVASPTTLAEGTTKVTVTATYCGETDTKEYDVTVNAAPQYVTWDLTIDETETATTDEISWTSEAVSMSDTKGSGGTNANNYYPGTPEKNYTSTRFYNGSTLTITPANGITITSVVYNVAGNNDNYANAILDNWTNAAASRNGAQITIVPTDGTKAISKVLTATSGCEGVTVYYTGTPVAISLDHITISGYKTTFTEGDDFSFGGTVTAHYDDESTKEVTEDATFSGYDMNTTGTQTVTVSYTENEVTKTATYDITVSEAVLGEYVLTSLADINAEDEVIITMTNSDGTYAISNNNGTTDAPTAVPVTISSNRISSPDATILWNISKQPSGDKFVIHPNGIEDKWLYCTNANNGVRVGKGDAKLFIIKDNYLYEDGTSDARYIGVYNNADFRCYKTIDESSNIAGQTLAFYVKAVASKTLTSISLDGQTTEFSEGSNFAFGGTVTAHYDDESTKDVTTSATFSGYDMSVLDTEQTITVSYTEGGVTKEASYTITVVSLPRYTVTIETPENGTLVVKNGEEAIASGTSVVSGTVLTIEATPAEGYDYQNWQYKVEGGSWVTKYTNYDYTVDSNVSFRANFEPIVTGTFTINYSVNGIIRKTETLDANASLNFPAVSSMYGKVFLGWTTSEVPDEVDEKPGMADALTATADATYYALFATRTSTGGSDELTKVDELVAGMDIILAMEEGGTPNMGISDVNIEKSTAVVSDTQSDWLKFSVNEIGDNTCLVYNNLFVTPSTSSKNMFSLSENNGTSFYINSNKHLAYMKGTDEFVLAENYDPNSEDKYYYRFYKESTINDGSSLQTYTPFFVYTDGSSTTYSAYTTLPSYVKLDESTTNGTYNNETFGTVKIIRSMKADDTWNSLCLPFSMNKEQIATAFGEGTDVRELTTASVTGTAPDEVLHLNFTQVTAIEAGKLYMVRVPAAITEFYVEDTEVNTAEPVQDYSKDGYTIQTHSNYNYMDGPTNGYVPVGSFVISSNKFMQVGSSTQKMKAFRGYITATDASGNPVKALGIGFIDPLTGINNVEFNTDARIYNLQGLQQSKLQKGINIVNGKKVIR